MTLLEHRALIVAQQTAIVLMSRADALRLIDMAMGANQSPRPAGASDHAAATRFPEDGGVSRLGGAAAGSAPPDREFCECGEDTVYGCAERPLRHCGLSDDFFERVPPSMVARAERLFGPRPSCVSVPQFPMFP